MEFDEREGRILAHREGALLAAGGPGTGKTTLLLERFARLVEEGVDPERVALFVLGRRAAREARDRLVKRLRRSVADLPVFSVHAYAFRTVVSRRFAELDYREPPRVLSAPEQYAWVRHALAEEDRDAWPRFGGLLTMTEFARQVADFVLRCQERLLPPDDLDAAVARVDRDDLAEVAAFYPRYLDALGAANTIDFGGLLFQTVSLLERGVPEDERFAHVMVDDYQDATPATEAIARALAGAGESVVLAADPAGHVFGYRGTTTEPLSRSGTAFGPLERIELSVNHRLGDRTAALAALEDPSAPAATGPTAGFEARLCAHPGEEAEAVAHELLRLRVDDDVAWDRMAVVLRRYGSYLTALRHALSRHGIPFVVVAEAADLAAEPANRPVIDLLRYVFRPERREDLLERLLASPVGGLDPHAVRGLRREARIRGLSLLELVEGDDGGTPLPPELGDPVERFRSLVRDVPDIARARGPDGLFFELWRSRSPFAAGLVAAAEGDPAGARDLDALTALSEALSRFVERRPDATVEDYLDAVEAAEFGADPWIPPEERRPGAVRVMSAHRAQGMEFDAVLVPGCLEGEFPSLSASAPLVSLDQVVDPATPWERVARRLAEERALFRLAVSRARGRTVLFASRSTGARNPRTPSRFASRMGLPWVEPDVDRAPAASLRGMEAALRRRLSNRDEEPARRLAATAALTLVGARPDTWWGRRDRTDTGLPMYPDVIRTSYSRLSTMENCGLQFLYAVELGLDPDESHQMWLGSLIHRIIDEVQRGDLLRQEDDVLAELERSWRPEVFPNRAIERQRFADAREMLLRWLRHERGDPIASERWFEFPLDGAIVRGRIDAVFPMENGHLRVVDYKTSRFPISEAQAKVDLQLAAYYLALLRSEELRDLGVPGYLQLDYLGKGRQADGFVRVGVAPRQIEGYEEWAQDTIRWLLERTRAEDFAPSAEADCHFCRFKTICPLWPEGAEVALS